MSDIYYIVESHPGGARKSIRCDGDTPQLDVHTRRTAKKPLAAIAHVLPADAPAFWHGFCLDVSPCRCVYHAFCFRMSRSAVAMPYPSPSCRIFSAPYESQPPQNQTRGMPPSLPCRHQTRGKSCARPESSLCTGLRTRLPHRGCDETPSTPSRPGILSMFSLPNYTCAGHEIQ